MKSSAGLSNLVRLSLQWDHEILLFFYQSSPLIFMFSSNYMYEMFYLCICFCLGIPLKRRGANNRLRKGSHGAIKTQWDHGIWFPCFNDTAGSTSMTPSNPQNLMQKCLCWIQRCCWDRGIRTLQTIIFEYLDKFEATCKMALARESVP
jgi:hypothetical protein